MDEWLSESHISSFYRKPGANNFKFVKFTHVKWFRYALMTSMRTLMTKADLNIRVLETRYGGKGVVFTRDRLSYEA